MDPQMYPQSTSYQPNYSAPNTNATTNSGYDNVQITTNQPSYYGLAPAGVQSDAPASAPASGGSQPPMHNDWFIPFDMFDPERLILQTAEKKIVKIKGRDQTNHEIRLKYLYPSGKEGYPTIKMNHETSPMGINMLTDDKKKEDDSDDDRNRNKVAYSMAISLDTPEKLQRWQTIVMVILQKLKAVADKIPGYSLPIGIIDGKQIAWKSFWNPIKEPTDGRTHAPAIYLKLTTAFQWKGTDVPATKFETPADIPISKADLAQYSKDPMNNQVNGLIPWRVLMHKKLDVQPVISLQRIYITAGEGGKASLTMLCRSAVVYNIEELPNQSINAEDKRQYAEHNPEAAKSLQDNISKFYASSTYVSMPNRGNAAPPSNMSQPGMGTTGQSSVPLMGNGYPNQGNGYPNQPNNGYPNQGSGYPQQNNGYPQQNNNGGYPQQNNNGYPQQGNNGGYPQQNNNGYPPQNNNGYPPQNNNNYRSNPGNNNYPSMNTNFQGQPNNGGYPQNSQMPSQMPPQMNTGYLPPGQIPPQVSGNGQYSSQSQQNPGQMAMNAQQNQQAQQNSYPNVNFQGLGSATQPQTH
jgi:hypothetical protein